MNLGYLGSLAALGSIGLVMTLSVYLPLSAGLLSVAPIGIMALGSYTYAIFLVNATLPAPAAFAIALVLSTVAGLIVGLLTVRLSGFSVAITTLGVAEVIYIIVNNLTITGGSGGFSGIPATSTPLVLAICAVVAVAGIAVLESSVLGRHIRAMQADEIAARSIGISSRFIRLFTMTVSGLLAGLGGCMYAGYLSYLDPHSFSLTAFNTYLMATIVGGMGSLLGPLVGTVLFTALPEVTRFLGGWRLFTFAILVLVILIVQPRGLVDWIRWPQLPRRRVRQQLPSREETPVLRFEHVRKSFGHVDVLRDVTFEVLPGTIHALIGPNGAGKTTLLNIASGFVKGDGGSVVLGTMRLDGRSSSEIARAGVVRTFQNPRLFKSMSVTDNLDAAVSRHADAPPIALLLEQLDLTLEARTSCAILPYGQQRRTEIARALRTGPACLVLDEPTAGMARTESDALLRLLAELKLQGLSILLVDHDMRFVMGVADRVTVLNAGGVIADGTPHEVQRDRAVMDAYLGTTSQLEEQ